ERILRSLDEVVGYQPGRREDVHDLATLEGDPEEVLFRDIEATTEEEEEPTFEEGLGMASRRRAAEAGEEGAEEAASDEKSADEGSESAATEGKDEEE